VTLFHGSVFPFSRIDPVLCVFDDNAYFVDRQEAEKLFDRKVFEEDERRRFRDGLGPILRISISAVIYNVDQFSLHSFVCLFLKKYWLIFGKPIL
jgi:hypothetical protein